MAFEVIIEDLILTGSTHLGSVFLSVAMRPRACLHERRVFS